MNYSPLIKKLDTITITLCTLIVLGWFGQFYFQEDKNLNLFCLLFTMFLAGASSASAIIAIALRRYERNVNLKSDLNKWTERCKELLLINGTSKDKIKTYEKVQSYFDGLPPIKTQKDREFQKEFLLHNTLVTKNEMKTYEEVQSALNELIDGGRKSGKLPKAFSK